MLAIIPARGGSKGVPGKNIRWLGGKPLIHWTIEAAKLSEKVDRIVLSTDDPKIAEICKPTGIEIPFLRPDELATDDSLAIDNYLYTMDQLNREHGYDKDEFVVFLPTVPFRSASDIDQAITMFYEKKADSVISCSQLQHPISWILAANEKGQIKRRLQFEESKTFNRQSVSQSYIPNGGIYVLKASKISAEGSYYSEKTYAYLMPSERSIDIDTEFDFMIAEFIADKYGF
ncbi:acylneuraminate cytidylyltransferase family protein [Litorivicinus sp.]|nr:acylneuraminate cytidylyltransferase family protein [Litorivicinus sp.]MDC1239984.1 acylneuraminate cytidylyltransferase family protein [Litorivicinus sp.]